MESGGAILNAHADRQFLEAITGLGEDSNGFLNQAVDHFWLSARGYHRVFRVARTIADLAGSNPLTSLKPSLTAV